MGESVGGNPNLVKYVGQPQPVMRNKEAKEAWLRVEEDNHRMQDKLEEIWREPPSTFHAPQGYLSLYNGHVYKAMNNGKATGPGVASTPWPPKGRSPNAKYKKEQQHLMEVENQRMAKKLHEIYSKRPASATKNTQGASLDVNDKWKLRTDFYRPQSAPSTSATNLSSSMEHHQPGRNVPKTQGVASCAGCSAKGYYYADGPSLFPCPKCKQVSYCSDSCMRVDWSSHKQLCKFYTTGVWNACGQRPSDEYWVNNKAMGAARRALEKLPPATTPEEELQRAERVQKIYDKVRAEEQAAERRQAEIERLANLGLDGPRPCMYMNGKPI